MSRSRRSCLPPGLPCPRSPPATRSEPEPQAPARTQSPIKALSSGPELRYKVLGKTGLKVTTVGFGCMITSDGSVVERAADMGITYFDTARNYSPATTSAWWAQHSRATQNLVLSTKTEGRTKRKRSPSWTRASRNSAPTLSISGTCTPRPGPPMSRRSHGSPQIVKTAGKTRFIGVSTHSGQKELIPWLATTRTST